MTATFESMGYAPSHPWFYHTGGKPLYPKQIKRCVMASGYRGYLAGEIERIDQSAEPKRTHELRAIKATALTELKRDLSRYREAVCELRQGAVFYDRRDPYRSIGDYCVSASLKHNHIYNGFAILNYVDELLTHQKDLFDLL
ncbi:hypothetical protein [Pseudovibrio sp. Ad26]|uniref:hypothetical protein n=1 Tax=Pseudovibrio sp. Ad26 TaxID=989410 RepID=UPI0007AEBEDB|nr:hypothetical protein [Pseudovibrio sp. Ad26]KZL16527.1 hypothetical protein PsAD26_00302 [Pseudovibrio sp. Ad26]